MGKRRKGVIADSLDLFLDTICNAFGGLLFLAILLTLLVQMRSSDNSGTSKQTVSTTDFEKLALEVRTAERRRDELTAQVLKLKQVTDGLASEPLQQKSNMLEEIQSRIDASAAKVQAETKYIESMLREIELVKEEIVKVKFALKDANEVLSHSKTQLSESLNSRERFFEAPVERVTMKSPLCFLMRYNRVYLVFNSSFDATINREHVEDLSVFGLTVVRPKENSGWDPTKDSEVQRMISVLSVASSEEFYCSIAIWPDSYGSFEKVKKVIIDSGFDYQLIPLSKQERVSYGVSGRDTFVQ
jgi:hypothetical protein